MKSASSSFRRAGVLRLCGALLTIVALTTLAYAQTSFTSGEKAKVKGTIIARNGDLVKVQEAKTGTSNQRVDMKLIVNKGLQGGM
jgi:hypothetical protein